MKSGQHTTTRWTVWKRPAIAIFVGGLLLLSGQARSAPSAQAHEPEKKEEPLLQGIRQRLAPMRAELYAIAEDLTRSYKDGTDIQDEIVNQEITMKGAEAAYQNARLMREVAEIAVKEFQEGTAKEDLFTADCERELAKKSVEASEKNLDELDKVIKKVEESGQRDVYRDWTLNQQRKMLELSIQRHKVEIDQAETKRAVLTQYTIPKRTKELQAEVEKTRLEELARNTKWELERQKLIRLQRNQTKDARSPLENELTTQVIKLCALDATIQSKATEARDSGKPEAAAIEPFVTEFQTQFKQVGSLWAGVQAERTENHYTAVRQRLSRPSRFPRPPVPPPSAQ